MTDKKVHENDDIWYALECNPPETFSPDDIKDIVAEVPGENDEFNWWWILKLGARKYALVDGACDYTGWDCQSGIEEHGIFSTAYAAAKAAPPTEKYSLRKIQANLIRQVRGKQPKFMYQEN